MMWLTLRRSLLGVLTFLSLAMGAAAQTDLFVKGSQRLFPIGLPRLCIQEGDSDAASVIPNTISRDLDLSGFFEVLNPDAYIEAPGKCGTETTLAYSDWSTIGAEAVVKGVVRRNGSSVKVELFLHNVPKQEVMLGKVYEGDLSFVPLMAHKFANEIMKAFTGEAGPFGSQIAFSSRVGRFKELFLMDMDGSNVRQLTNDKSLAMSPAWSRKGDMLALTSYRNRTPDLFLFDLATKKLSQVTRSEALEISPKFSRDDRSLLLSRNTGRDSGIVLVGRDGALLRNVTQPGGAIDVSPSYSPDDSRIAFCSNRAGGPQIYTMNQDGSDVQRISYVTSNYCTSPAWSPKGDKIAFVCRAESGFHLFVSNADGSDPLQLTSSGSNEDPDWSPDGRYLIFASTFGRGGAFSLAMIRADGTGMRQLTNSRGGDFEPTWGPIPQ